jgi:hypothetical protein
MRHGWMLQENKTDCRPDPWLLMRYPHNDACYSLRLLVPSLRSTLLVLVATSSSTDSSRGWTRSSHPQMLSFVSFDKAPTLASQDNGVNCLQKAVGTRHMQFPTSFSYSKLVRSSPYGLARATCMILASYYFALFRDNSI